MEPGVRRSTSRTMQRAAVVLPLPDSPTRPSVSFGADAKRHVVEGHDAARGAPARDVDPACACRRIGLRQAVDARAAAHRMGGATPRQFTTTGRPSRAPEARRRGSSETRRRRGRGRGNAARRGSPAAGRRGRAAGRRWVRAARVRLARSSPGMAARRPACRDAGGCCSTTSAGAGLDDAPGVHDRDHVSVLRDDAHVVRDEDHGHAGLVAELAPGASRIWSWMVTSRAVVGSSARSSRGRSRWRARS